MMLWTREAVLLFAERLFAEYAGRELTSEEQEKAARKARIIDFDAVKCLKRGEPKVLVTGDVSRFYVKDR